MEVINGDCGLVYTPFKLTNIKTYLSACIRFFINIWNRIFKEEICRYNHAVIFVELETEMYVFEAVEKGFIKSKYSEWIIGRKPKDVLILRPLFMFDNQMVKDKALQLEGKDYDFESLFIAQVIKQLFEDVLWVGSKNDKKVYCSEAVARIWNYATNFVRYRSYYKTDPEDLFVDSKLLRIKPKNL